MCGIAGMLGGDAGAGFDERLRKAAGVLRHRGPDGHATWSDMSAGIGFAHTRLAILDLSPAGAQPMQSADGRWVIVYNGEVYNHVALRRELAAAGGRVGFRGNSDTETILESCAHWGVEPAVGKFVGMFAFALWDRKDRLLYLVRDRLGIKPLYWGRVGGVLLFGSELKALAELWRQRPGVDRGALRACMRLGYVPAPRSIYIGVEKLPPGSILKARAGVDPAVTRYWRLDQVVETGLGTRTETPDEDCIARTGELLEEAVRMRLLSDVPLGAFLSGGIDSSTVVALMQRHSRTPVRTFTAGFSEQDYDETRHAAAIARHLGTDHTELRVSPGDAMALIPELPSMFDEPFGDSSQIPTHLIARLTRKHVTVALSGDGGDEVFAGYNRHVLAAGILKQSMHLPQPLRSLLAGVLRLPGTRGWDALAAILPSRFRVPQAGDKAELLAVILSGGADPYAGLVSRWSDNDPVVLGGDPEPEEGVDRRLLDQIAAETERMQYRDTAGYLPDDILAKVDRATMATSLECRVPLLDHRVVEAAWRLPLHMKVRNGQGKWILRRILERYVPPHLFERPKTGFAVPIDAWLRTGLRDWAAALLDPRRLREQGYFDANAVRRKWQEHLEGRRNRHHHLWNVLMFQAWHERWIG